VQALALLPSASCTARPTGRAGILRQPSAPSWPRRIHTTDPVVHTRALSELSWTLELDPAKIICGSRDLAVTVQELEELRCMMHTLLLDHDNIDFSRISVRQLLNSWINADPILQVPGPPLQLRLRAYGGWFAENVSSDSRHRAAEMYTDNSPSLFKHGDNYYSVSFEFADELGAFGAKSVRITNTVVRRGSNRPVSTIRNPPACDEFDCDIKATKRWLRHNRACSRAACPTPFSDHFERVEQKQVDVHLAVDLLSYLATTSSQVGIVTDDADVLPALGAAAANATALGRLTVLRFNSRGTYLDPYLRQNGVRIAQLPT